MASAIRNSAKAVIIRDGALLLIRKESDAGDYYIFPGGGQEKFEELRSTVRRECQEEIGTDIIVNDLVWVREYIAKHHEFADLDAEIHQVEFYFSCSLPAGAEPTNGPAMDDRQVAVEWIPLRDLPKTEVYPRGLRSEFADPSQIYFGDIN